ncbi:ATP-binding cassette domain-containing protein [Streptomyces africanus]|uniref:ATP-binding cassette domain-containing protein n=1 Tax=Streptomyces africanus TaxID=231024 RepID=UPI00244B5AAE|nr:ATP-binding cassette domain-containing protein [Streptomyces africanus]
MSYADSPPAFHADGLTKKYGRRGKPALSDVNLTIPSGRVIGLVGPNGAGKSTLLHLACGLIEPTSGSLTVLGSRPAGPCAPQSAGRTGLHVGVAEQADERVVPALAGVAPPARTVRGEAASPPRPRG